MKMLIGVMILVISFGCSGRKGAQTTESVKTESLQDDRVEVVYFHGKQRCVTCRSIEEQTRKILSEDYADELKNGKIVFREVDISDKEGEKVADTYEVTWSSLFVNRWKGGKEIRNNMTDFAFSKAVGDKAGFKAGLKAKIEELIK